MMLPSESIDRYLGLFRLRLKQLTTAQGLGIMAVTAIVITVAAVALAIRTGFPDDVVITSRLLLFGSLSVSP